MKFFLKTIVILLVLVSVFGSCRKQNIIPDRELKVIFKEFYLANSYFTTVKAGSTDSLDVYRAILKKYGYNLNDLEQTIASFSRRKSSKLSDVLESAIDELQNEFNYYEERVAVLDTIDARASRLFKRTLFEDSSIVVTRIADTAKLRFIMPVEEGKYEISYIYEIDSLDKNTSLRTTFNTYDSLGKRGTSSSNWMNSRRRTTYSTTVDTKPTDSILVILFGNYTEKLTRPYITIDSLKISYYLPRDKALDSLGKVIIPYKVPPYELPAPEEQIAEADSSTLAVDTLGVDSLGSDNGR